MRIGTRSSAMALAQTEEIKRAFEAAHRGLSAKIVHYAPKGDRDQVSRLSTHGGKGGAFVAEIRDAMRAGALDAAMHSLKDMPGDEEAPGLLIGAYMPREAVEDALVLRKGLTLERFKEARGRGFRVGTNSVRRAAYMRRLYPDAEIIHFRGAADTRIKKLDERAMQRLPDGGEVGPADALIMAKCGLERVGLGHRLDHVFSSDEMLPAVGQGIVAVECSSTDWATQEKLSAIDSAAARTCALAEREMLWVLNGHCNAPIAGHAMMIDGDTLTLRGAVIDHAGDAMMEESQTGRVDRPREIGRAVGLALLAKGAGAVLEATRPT